MADEQTDVVAEIPSGLYRCAELLADLHDTDVDEVFVTALEQKLASITATDEFQNAVAAQYYNDEITRDEVEVLFGPADARRLEALKETLDNDAPAPDVPDELPTAEEFYGDEGTEWPPDTSDTDNSETKE